ncbi:transposase [Micromonospora sp. KC606]|uniref:transposase n=1 Tax=Micromonospora sp. KC606 TaxID=2530379 RepID=UPI001404B3E9|nr:transposase [Micromonospora sp. KC606]
MLPAGGCRRGRRRGRDRGGCGTRRGRPRSGSAPGRRLRPGCVRRGWRSAGNLDANQAQTRQTTLAETHSRVTEIHGVGHILAGKILGHVGDVTRFPTADHFASYTGTAPLEASSGERRRHRLNPTGNRQLNTALHTIAVCQARDPGPGRVYYLRKISEGKTPAEARRALKRRLTNVLYRQLIKDQLKHLTATG